MDQICIDLKAQYEQTDDRVSALDASGWRLQTPFCQWTVFDQVAHIAFFDLEALLALEDPDAFRRGGPEIMALLEADGEWPAKTNPWLGVRSTADLLHLWRKTRSDLIERLRGSAPGHRIPWYGPEMGARSFATARLMETWAHTQDICDALRIKRTPTNRLRHIAHLGVAAFGWSFQVRGLSPPPINPRVVLAGPWGDLWTWGPPDALETVRGSAEEFCLVVTQRRHVSDTALESEGRQVKRWLSMAQAFAGIAQDPPAPGERVVRYASNGPPPRVSFAR